MAFSILGYFLCMMSVLWPSSIVLNHLISPLRSIPGPFFARFTKLWFLIGVWRRRFHEDIVALHRQYGPVVRYGPHHYSFCGTEAVELIYGRGTEFDKSDWYSAWNAPGFKSLFTEPSVKVHSQLRRKFQPTYSMSSLVTYEAFVDHCIGLLRHRLEEISAANEKTDIAHWMLCYAGDSISMITYSERMGFLDTGKDIGGFFKNLHGNSVYNSLMGIYSGLHPFVFNTIAWLNKLNLTDGTPRMFVARFTSDSISEKKRERASQEKLGSLKFTERDITIGLIGNVIAGSDTTAAALTSILYCLLKNPTCLAKLRDEISSRTGAGELSSPPTFKEVHDMRYLQAVLQEAMRVYPHGGLPFQRVVPGDGAEICGHYFPAGTVVDVSSWVMHLDTSIFGEDAHDFRPERWLEAGQESLAQMQRYWIPFGLGSRTCIGKDISMLEITKAIPELLRWFEFELADELKEADKKLEWSAYSIMRPVALPVKVRVRQNQ